MLFGLLSSWPPLIRWLLPELPGRASARPRACFGLCRKFSDFVRASQDLKKLIQVGALVENVLGAQFEQFSTWKLIGHTAQDNRSAGQPIALDGSKNIYSPHFRHQFQPVPSISVRILPHHKSKLFWRWFDTTFWFAHGRL